MDKGFCRKVEAPRLLRDLIKLLGRGFVECPGGIRWTNSLDFQKLKSFDLVFQNFRNILIFYKNFIFWGKT